MTAKTYTQNHETASEMPSFWTREKDAFLIALWKEGLTCSRIAGELGAASKNCVLGRVHRLGLKPRSTKVRSLKGRLVNPVGRPPNAPSQIVQLDEVPNWRKLLDPRVNTRGKCRWIDGEPEGVHTVFCASAVSVGKSYCPVHDKACVWDRAPIKIPNAA